MRGGRQAPEDTATPGAYEVWQLTDGTVVIRGSEDPTPAISGRRFTWFNQHGIAPRPTWRARLRHRLLAALDYL